MEVSDLERTLLKKWEHLKFGYLRARSTLKFTAPIEIDLRKVGLTLYASTVHETFQNILQGKHFENMCCK